MWPIKRWVAESACLGFEWAWPCTNLLSMPETLGNWSDSRISCRHLTLRFGLDLAVDWMLQAVVHKLFNCFKLATNLADFVSDHPFLAGFDNFVGYFCGVF